MQNTGYTNQLHVSRYYKNSSKYLISMYCGIFELLDLRNNSSQDHWIERTKHFKFEEEDEGKAYILFLQIIVFTSSNMWLVSNHKWDNTIAFIYLNLFPCKITSSCKMCWNNRERKSTKNYDFMLH